MKMIRYKKCSIAKGYKYLVGSLKRSTFEIQAIYDDILMQYNIYLNDYIINIQQSFAEGSFKGVDRANGL